MLAWGFKSLKPWLTNFRSLTRKNITLGCIWWFNVAHFIVGGKKSEKKNPSKPIELSNLPMKSKSSWFRNIPIISSLKLLPWKIWTLAGKLLRFKSENPDATFRTKTVPSTLENSSAVHQKMRYWGITWFSDFIPRYMSRRSKSFPMQKYIHRCRQQHRIESRQELK